MQLSIRSKVAAVGLAGVVAVMSVAGVAMAEGRPSGGHRGGAATAAIKNIIEESGLDSAVFKEGAEAGKSIDVILAENGLDADVIEAAVLADLDAKLDEKVAAGDLTEEQAGVIAAKAADALDRLMAATPDGERPGGGHDANREQVRRALIGIAADTIGVTAEALVAELKDGATIAEVATENGVAPETVIDAMVDAAEARVDAAVANGNLPAEKAEAVKAKLAERIAKLVNEGRPSRGA